MTKLITTSVVRGSHQGESHGGVYLIDLDNQIVEQKLDWNRTDIDWQGRGWDRGLRGIAFDGNIIYIAASDELFAYTPEFELVASWKNAYLKHCHEICIYERTLFITSTAFDSILAFDLDVKKFTWGMRISNRDYKFFTSIFDPESDEGPIMLNRIHINNVFCNRNGMYISGLKTDGMLHFNGKKVHMSVELPEGVHNARPFRDGVLFNDSQADALRYAGRGEGNEDRAMPVPRFEPDELLHAEGDTTGIARASFARGLCVLSNSIVAGGSSPSTITVYDLATNMQMLSVNLTNDVRNAIHGLEVWPY
jgi:hypothetical protein